MQQNAGYKSGGDNANIYRKCPRLPKNLQLAATPNQCNNALLPNWSCLSMGPFPLFKIKRQNCNLDKTWMQWNVF